MTGAHQPRTSNVHARNHPAGRRRGGAPPELVAHLCAAPYRPGRRAALCGANVRPAPAAWLLDDGGALRDPLPCLGCLDAEERQAGHELFHEVTCFEPGRAVTAAGK